MADNIDYTQGLYVGEVMHQRNTPFFYKFKYGVFSLKIDIDHIEATAHKLRWLSFNRFNLLSLYTCDHGSRDGRPWRAWFDEFMITYGLKQPAKRVELLCLPRVLGVSFNPLSMWFAYDVEDRLIAVIAEVSNTFGQWHHYVLCHQGNPLDSVNTVHNSASLAAQADKAFHVSPFIDMAQRYHFRFKAPKKHYQMHISEWEIPINASLKVTESETKKTGAPALPLLIATQSGIYQPLNNSNLLKQFLRLPWQSLKVISMIHWWALKIWLKGGKFHRTPAALRDIDYSHSEMQFKQT